MENAGNEGGLVGFGDRGITFRKRSGNPSHAAHMEGNVASGSLA